MRFRYLIHLLLFVYMGVATAQQSPLPPGALSPDSPVPAPQATGSAGKSATVAPALAAVEDKIDTHNYGAARPLVLSYLQAHPDDARALFDLGYIEDSTGQEDGAEQHYRKAIASDPQQFEARAALGLLLAQTGKNPEAQEQLLAATKLEPASHDAAAKAQAWRTLAQLQVAGDPAAAKESLLQALKLTPDKTTPADLLLTAQIAEASNDPATADTAYHRLLAMQPDSAPATAGLSHLLLQQKKYADAEPLIRVALEKNPNDPTLNAQLASALAGQNKTDQAIPVLEKVHALEPENAEIGLTLADTYMMDAGAHPESLEKAGALLPTLLKTHPDDVGLLMDYSRFLFLNKRYAEALPVLERAAQLAPHDEDPWNGLAFAHSELHQGAETLKSLEMRSKIAQDTPETLFLWATAYDTVHQSKQAAAYYKRFLTAAHGSLPDQEWQAQHRLIALGQGH